MGKKCYFLCFTLFVLILALLFLFHMVLTLFLMDKKLSIIKKKKKQELGNLYHTFMSCLLVSLQVELGVPF